MTISSEITNILNDLGSRLGVAVDWSSQNVMPYLQELVSRIAKLQIVNSIVWLIIAIISVVICIICINVFRKMAKNEYDYSQEEFYCITAGVCLFIFGALALGGFVWALSTLPEAIFLPELTAFEYIKGLVGGIQ